MREMYLHRLTVPTRKFSDEQIKNLGVITKLYHGDTQALVDLIDEYKTELANALETSDDKEVLTKHIGSHRLTG